MNKFFKAFTLAEILVTLTIIGIVATLTLPNIMAKSQQKQFNTALTKAINILANSNKMLLYKENSENLMEICGVNYINDCLRKITPLTYNKEFDLYQTKEPFGYRLLGLGTDQSTNDDVHMDKFFKVLVDVNGVNKPNKDCLDRYVVWVDINGTVVDTKGCKHEETEPISGNSDTPTSEQPADNVVPQSTLIKCRSTLDSGYGTCESKGIKDFYVEDEDSVAIETDGGGTADGGKRMTYELADKTCKAKGMRLPEVLELNSMYNASVDGQVNEFNQFEYWAHNPNCSDADSYNCHNCYMGRGNCGRARNTTLNYVRCVK